MALQWLVLALFGEALGRAFGHAIEDDLKCRQMATSMAALQDETCTHGVTACVKWEDLLTGTLNSGCDTKGKCAELGHPTSCCTHKKQKLICSTTNFGAITQPGDFTGCDAQCQTGDDVHGKPDKTTTFWGVESQHTEPSTTTQEATKAPVATPAPAPVVPVACMSYPVIPNGHNSATCSMTPPASCKTPQNLVGSEKKACAGTTCEQSLKTYQISGTCKEAYDPCAGQAEGHECKVCDPQDKHCVETAEIKTCQHGKCRSDSTSLSEGNTQAYDPCAGKAEGEQCQICDPKSKDCEETTEINTCLNGQCGSQGAQDCTVPHVSHGTCAEGASVIAGSSCTARCMPPWTPDNEFLLCVNGTLSPPTFHCDVLPSQGVSKPLVGLAIVVLGLLVCVVMFCFCHKCDSPKKKESSQKKKKKKDTKGKSLDAEQPADTDTNIGGQIQEPSLGKGMQTGGAAVHEPEKQALLAGTSTPSQGSASVAAPVPALAQQTPMYYSQLQPMYAGTAPGAYTTVSAPAMMNQPMTIQPSTIQPSIRYVTGSSPYSPVPSVAPIVTTVRYSGATASTMVATGTSPAPMVTASPPASSIVTYSNAPASPGQPASSIVTYSNAPASPSKGTQ